jgi:glycosyltransferase involved in cell wall biosynthesis
MTEASHAVRGRSSVNRPPIYIIGYAEHITGGVSNITTSLRQGDSRFELHPALYRYGSPLKSALLLLRSLASITIKRIRRGAGVAIFVIGSKGDTARSIPFSVLLKILGFSVFYYFHTDLKVLAGSRFYPAARTLWVKLGSAHVFLSPRLARSATEVHRFPAGRCHVIPNGIDPHWSARLPAPYRERTLDAVFVGRWSPEKGVADLVELFSPSRLGQRYRCHVFGDTRPSDGSCDHANLEFHGWRDPTQVEDAIRSARILILPSYAEAYPTVLIEAAACGTPFVATHIAGIPDIADQSRCGLTVPAGDVGALQTAVMALVENDVVWGQASSAGYAWAGEQSTERMVTQWRHLLARLERP